MNTKNFLIPRGRPPMACRMIDVHNFVRKTKKEIEKQRSLRCNKRASHSHLRYRCKVTPKGCRAANPDVLFWNQRIFNQFEGPTKKDLLYTKNVLNKKLHPPEIQAYYTKARNQRKEHKTLLKKLKKGIDKQKRIAKTQQNRQRALENRQRALDEKTNNQRKEHQTLLKKLKKGRDEQKRLTKTQQNRQRALENRQRALDEKTNKIKELKSQVHQLRTILGKGKKRQQCIGEPNKHFTGNEPSPKGVGYCAGNRQIGEIRIGKDGNLWIVKAISSGIRRWQRYTPPSKLSQTIKRIVNSGNLTSGRLITYNVNSGIGI